MDELWGCFKYVGIPFESLWKMPVRTRRYFIHRHNEAAAEERENMNRTQGVSKSNNPALLQAVAKQTQNNNFNTMRQS